MEWWPSCCQRGRRETPSCCDHAPSARHTFPHMNNHFSQGLQSHSFYHQCVQKKKVASFRIFCGAFPAHVEPSTSVSPLYRSRVILERSSSGRQCVLVARKSEQNSARRKILKMVGGGNYCCQRLHGSYQLWYDQFSGKCDHATKSFGHCGSGIHSIQTRVSGQEHLFCGSVAKDK